MNIELKPCPFCGGEAEMMGDQYPYVECQECAAGFTANHSYEFDEDDAASKWNARSAAGPKLKPIAESKVRQLGGDVCGVLVRTQDSEVMAVSEHGCCTRLDAGVMGLVEPAGMSERELFEQRFPVPAGIYWNDISEQYDALPGAAGFDDVEIYHGQWMGWQAARAQGGQGAEVDTVYVDCRECDVCGHAGINDSHESYAACHRCDWSGPEPEQDRCPGCDEENCMAAACPECSGCYVLIAEKTLTTQPRPAQQGSLPEGWRELVNCVQSLVRQKSLSDSDTISVGLWKQDPDKPQFHAQFDFRVAHFNTTPQPEGDGWVKCEDRLPSEADADLFGEVLVFDHGKLVRRAIETVLNLAQNTHHGSQCYWKPTGLKRPQPPKQEGKGDA